MMHLIGNKDHIKEVCGLGTKGAETCSYLGMLAEGMACLKGGPLELEIILRRSEGTMNAMGDNCDGWHLQPRTKPPYYTLDLGDIERE